MASASAFAESTRTTRYSMLLPEVFLEFLQGSDSPGLQGGQAALDSLQSLHLVDVVQQPLVGSGILDNHFCLAVDCEDHWVASLAHPFQELAAVPFEIAQGLDVLADVERATLNLHLI